MQYFTLKLLCESKLQISKLIIKFQECSLFVKVHSENLILIKPQTDTSKRNIIANTS